MKRWMSSMVLGLALAVGCAAPVMADSRKVVTLGADLTEAQQNTMLRYFGVSSDAVDIIYINNTDEREHLGSYVPLEQIGTKTFSCALVAPTTSGGIQVKTANLSWVTCNMIASTLSTSGVTNCQVVAASPFEVSGTGALTGVIMAYETASEESLSEEKKDLANEELVTTGNLANEVGQSKATAVINETKLQVIENNITDITEITNIVNNVSNDYDVTITDDQSAEIAELMQKIAEQEYDITQLKATLERVQANVAGDAGASEEDQAALESAAQAAEAAAAEEAAQTEATTDDGGITIDEGTETTESENILENTDISALEEGGATIDEGTTTQTVQEQSEAAETETDSATGIPEATGDETESTTEAATEAAAAGETESEATEDDLMEADQAMYDEVKADLEDAFAGNMVSAEDGSTVYLTEDAATKVPEAVEKYLIKVLVNGGAAVEEEEAKDSEIPANIIEETQDLAEDKDYESEDLAQIDKYVRRLVLKDSEKLLADSQLENNDAVILYESIMSVLEKGFGVEDTDETIDEAAEEAVADQIDDSESVDDGYTEEFEDFVEETGTY